jgi:sterol desaturase/sphingolipid hydroxylase (fatty acid hydroxylase superfamily)
MVRGNYGLYFRWWDKICGTEFPDYEARYQALFAAKRAGGMRPVSHDQTDQPCRRI